jgi:hypothetical protein
MTWRQALKVHIGCTTGIAFLFGIQVCLVMVVRDAITLLLAGIFVGLFANAVQLLFRHACKGTSVVHPCGRAGC